MLKMLIVLWIGLIGFRTLLNLGFLLTLLSPLILKQTWYSYAINFIHNCMFINLKKTAANYSYELYINRKKLFLKVFAIVSKTFFLIQANYKFRISFFLIFKKKFNINAFVCVCVCRKMWVKPVESSNGYIKKISCIIYFKKIQKRIIVWARADEDWVLVNSNNASHFVLGFMRGYWWGGGVL